MAYINATESTFAMDRAFKKQLYPPSLTDKSGETHWIEGRQGFSKAKGGKGKEGRQGKGHGKGCWVVQLLCINVTRVFLQGVSAADEHMYVYVCPYL